MEDAIGGWGKGRNRAEGIANKGRTVEIDVSAPRAVSGTVIYLPCLLQGQSPVGITSNRGSHQCCYSVHERQIIAILGARSIHPEYIQSPYYRYK